MDIRCRLLASVMQAMNRILAVEYSLNPVGKFAMAADSAIIL